MLIFYDVQVGCSGQPFPGGGAFAAQASPASRQPGAQPSGSLPL